MAGNSEHLACKFFADALDGYSDILFVFNVGDDFQNFLSSEAATNVGLSSVQPENSSEALEHDVPGIVFMRIVDALEAVEIGHSYPNREMVARRSAQFVRGPGIYRTAIGQAREWIGEGPSLSVEDSWRAVVGVGQQYDGLLLRVHAVPQDERVWSDSHRLLNSI